MYRFDGSTLLVIHIDVTHTVTHQTTHILPPAGTQNALGESHKKASTQQATRRTGVLARCRRAHCARFGRWRSQKHRWWPSAGVSGGGRDLTLRADDPTSRGTTRTRIMWVNEKSSAQFVYVRLRVWLGWPQASPREPLRCHISSLVIVETLKYSLEETQTRQTVLWSPVNHNSTLRDHISKIREIA